MTRSYNAGARHWLARTEIPTPTGPMTAIASEAGLAVLRFGAASGEDAALQLPEQPGHPHLAAARRWLDAYWSGPAAPDVEVALDLHGTLFQRAVWQALRSIPHGSTRSYGQLAAAIGNGAVPRATGAACGANPVALIVPCHRVIGADGSLTGFAGGIETKQRLLQHEGALLV